MDKLIDQFDAVDDTGQTHTILIYQTFVDIQTRAGTDLAAGLKRAVTSTGMSLNVIDHETFEVVGTGQKLHKSLKRDGNGQ